MRVPRTSEVVAEVSSHLEPGYMVIKVQEVPGHDISFDHDDYGQWLECTCGWRFTIVSYNISPFDVSLEALKHLREAGRNSAVRVPSL